MLLLGMARPVASQCAASSCTAEPTSCAEFLAMAKPPGCASGCANEFLEGYCEDFCADMVQMSDASCLSDVDDSGSGALVGGIVGGLVGACLLVGVGPNPIKP